MNIIIAEITEITEVDGEIIIDCSERRDGCTGHVDVEYVPNILVEDLYNEISWQWICRACQGSLRDDV